MRFNSRLLAVLALLLLAAPVYAQSSTDASDTSTVTVAWAVADELVATGDVTATFDTVTATGFGATVTGSHTLTYSNNQSTNRKITVQIDGTKPTGMSLKASASPTVGTGSTDIEVMTTVKNLVTGIPSDTTDATATVTYSAESTEQIADGTLITIKYTITAQ